MGELVCAPPQVDGNRILLGYAAQAGSDTEHEFTEVIELPGPVDQVPDDVLQPVLRLLSLAAALSYFKAFAPAAISVPGGLTDQERRFVSELTTNGLGEFAFTNDLPEVLDTEIVAPHRADAPSGPSQSTEPQRALVAVGGGKDSIVSIELLKAAGIEMELFCVNSFEPIDATARVAELPLRSARRQLDPELFRLNALGAPNGHVPVTAVNSLVAILTALALDFDTVVFSNEASSSYGNVQWHGRDINHQWSKGAEFERLLRASLPPGAPQYISLLRPLTELRIARRFAQHTAYHGVFTSCNRAFKIKAADRSTWCADCPKCRFVFLTLAPFLSRAALLEIFAGRDMFADERQHEGFLELLGADGLLKPFECVGEPDECAVALGLLREHPQWSDHPFLAQPDVAGLAVALDDHEEVFAFREHEHFLSPRLEAAVREV